MKYVKMLGLLALSAAALMAFSGTASAEVATSPAGTTYTSTIHATSEGHAILHSPAGFTIECASTVTGKIEKHGAGHIAVSGKLSTVDFTGCTNGWEATVVEKLGVKQNGSLSVTCSGGVCTATGIGQEVTVRNAGLGLHCVYATGAGTTLGTVDNGTPARLTISATIPRTAGETGILCGSTGTWTGTYKVTTPGTLIIDTS